MLAILCRPKSCVSQRTCSSPRASVKRLPKGPLSISYARTFPVSIPAETFRMWHRAYNLSISPPVPKKAQPSFGSDSISSNFALATVAMLPKVSKCAAPMLVITPYCGSTNWQSSRMSPTCREPISAIKTSQSSSSCSLITRESPIGVLVLPGEAYVLYFSERMVARANLVEVLPKLPVIPILISPSIWANLAFACAANFAWIRCSTGCIRKPEANGMYGTAMNKRYGGMLSQLSSPAKRRISAHWHAAKRIMRGVNTSGFFCATAYCD